MGGWADLYVKLCRVDDVLVGDLKQFNVGEKEILVVNFNDKFLCFDARCTHAGAPLAEGDLNDNVLTCPWHGSQFNILDGSVIKGPAQKPLKLYNHTIKENLLFIEI